MITLEARQERQRLEQVNTPVAPGSPWPYLLLVILAGYLLFAHGCHADEDTELRVKEFITCFSR